MVVPGLYISWMHLFLFTNFTQRELVPICTRRVYATAINFPGISTLICFKKTVGFYNVNQAIDRLENSFIFVAKIDLNFKEKFKLTDSQN